MTKLLSALTLIFFMSLTTQAIANEKMEYLCTKDGEDTVLVTKSDAEALTQEGWVCSVSQQ